MSTPAQARAHVAANPHISALVVPHAGEPFALGALPLAQRRVLVRIAS
jgi:zona occludens toxin (predicted ATPase)